MDEPKPKEYIITESELARLHSHFIPLSLPAVIAAERQEFMRVIRSHPLPAPEAPAATNLPDDYWLCPFKRGCEEGEGWCDWPCDKWAIWHDAAIRKEEREKVLDDIAQYCQKHQHCCSNMLLWVVSVEPLAVFMKSLREQP